MTRTNRRRWTRPEKNARRDRQSRMAHRHEGTYTGLTHGKVYRVSEEMRGRPFRWHPQLEYGRITYSAPDNDVDEYGRVGAGVGKVATLEDTQALVECADDHPESFVWLNDHQGHWDGQQVHIKKTRDYEESQPWYIVAMWTTLGLVVGPIMIALGLVPMAMLGAGVGAIVGVIFGNVVGNTIAGTIVCAALMVGGNIGNQVSYRIMMQRSARGTYVDSEAAVVFWLGRRIGQAIGAGGALVLVLLI